jgi:Amt family ammonium transporter
VGISDPDTCLENQSISAMMFAMFEMMFAAITPLLITGAYAERLRFPVFLFINTAWEILVYYPVAHWVWGSRGWLAQMDVVDFAGGIVIHVTAGVSAIVFALGLGRRRHSHAAPSNVPLAAVGGALLWMGWFGFNAGSALSAGSLAGAVVANTQVAAVTAAVVWMGLEWNQKSPNVVHILNGGIAGSASCWHLTPGLAGITPAAGFVTVQSAAVLGLVFGLASWAGAKLIHHFKVDDALEVRYFYCFSCLLQCCPWNTRPAWSPVCWGFGYTGSRPDTSSGRLDAWGWG